MCLGWGNRVVTAKLTLLALLFCSYVNYSNIAARVVRNALKADLRADAVKRDESHIKFTPWINGKPASKYSVPLCPQRVPLSSSRTRDLISP